MSLEHRAGTGKRILMVAFHFPPMKGSSGLQRTLNFARDLPQHGWSPRVISAHPSAYPTTSNEQLGDIPRDVVVRRLPCLDAARHLAIRGRYPAHAAMPDRWWSWLFTSVPVGLWECLRWKPDVIWSTFPIPSAILVGRVLAQVSGKPWVVDLRDSITEEEHPHDPTLRSMLRGIEAGAVRRARSVVFTSQGALDMYASRYPAVPANRWNLIANGYDEESFRAAEQQPSTPLAVGAPRLRLLHSGLLDPVDRNPRSFFAALAKLVRDGIADSLRLEITLRATAHDDLYREWLADYGVQQIVKLAPPIPYVDALREMLDVDGLLVFQGANCNHQTPAKVYEYMRAGRPIFAVTAKDGDTAAALRLAGCPEDSIATMGDEVEIATRLGQFLTALESRQGVSIDPKVALRWRRSAQSANLASLLDRLVPGH